MIRSLVLLTLAMATTSHAAPRASTILRKAELIRNPFFSIVAPIDLSVLSRASGRELRSSRYTLITHRDDRTLLLMHQPDAAAPGALLIGDDTYWLLLPDADRPIELAMHHVIGGELSHIGFFRTNLRIRYRAEYLGDETLDDIACWRLELQPTGESPFGRVRYWVAEESFRPIRLEYDSTAGELLKTVRFVSYQDSVFGMRPKRIEIEDTARPEERAVLILGGADRFHTSHLEFDTRELLALRAVARRLASAGETASGRRLVEAFEATVHPAR